MRLENPVLGRELIENLRSPRAFLLQSIYVALLILIILVAWPSKMELAAADRLSLEVYDIFARGQLILLMLLAPILSAPAIASEREHRSLDLLLTAPLSPFAIVLGKLLSALTYLLLISLSSLPVVSVCLRLSSIGIQEILATYILLFASALLCGAIGLAASVWMGRSRAALSVSYVTIFPLALLLIFMNPMRNLRISIFLASLATAVTFLLVYLAVRRLRQPFDTIATAAVDENREEQVGLVLDQRRFPDNLLCSKGAGKPMDESGNPVYEKELRYELFGRGTLLMRLLLQLGLVAALPFFIASLIAGMWVFSFYILVFIILLAPSLSAGSFTNEREQNTLDLLLTTALTPRQIIRAKVGVSLRNILILTVFFLPLLLLHLIINLCVAPERNASHQQTILSTLGTVGVLFTTILLVVAIASFFSIISRTTLRSIIFTYLTIGCLFFVPLLLYQILTRFTGTSPSTAAWAGLTSPFFALATMTPDNFVAYGLQLPQGSGVRHILSYIFPAAIVSAFLYGLLSVLFAPFCQFRHERNR